MYYTIARVQDCFLLLNCYIWQSDGERTERGLRLIDEKYTTKMVQPDELQGLHSYTQNSDYILCPTRSNVIFEHKREYVLTSPQKRIVMKQRARIRTFDRDGYTLSFYETSERKSQSDLHPIPIAKNRGFGQ